MRSGNPVFNNSTFTRTGLRAGTQPMTIGGVVQKSFILLLLVAGTAALTWNYGQTHLGAVSGIVTLGAIGGLILGLVTSFKINWAPVTAPIYAVFEGAFIGGISMVFETKFHGIVFQAVCLTFGTMFALLAAYQSRLIRVNDTFRSVIVAATGGILIVYLINMVMGLFFHHPLSIVTGNGTLSIGFSIVVVVIAALNLVLDFDFVERATASGAPKPMEWYAAFGLIVTLVWLYIEILRLLAKTRQR
jgi:uncharacterized YccA/Bax inhibitor family protein